MRARRKLRSSASGISTAPDPARLATRMTAVAHGDRERPTATSSRTSRAWVQPRCTAITSAANRRKQASASLPLTVARAADRGRSTAALEIGDRAKARAGHLAGVLVQHAGRIAGSGGSPVFPPAGQLLLADVHREQPLPGIDGDEVALLHQGDGTADGGLRRD